MNKDAAAKFGISKYDTSDHLRDDEEARLYLMACVEEAGDDAAFIAKALGKIAKSRVAMTDVAQKTGLSRESLYKALSGDRDPSFSTILKVSSALGLRLSFSCEPAPAATSTQNVNTTGNSAPISKPRYARQSQKHSSGFDIFNSAASVGREWNTLSEEWTASYSLHHAFIVAATGAPTNLEDIEIGLGRPEHGVEVEIYQPSFFIEEISVSQTH